MKRSIQKIAVTGACGNIGYNLIFQIAAGAFLGRQSPISLHLLEQEPMMPSLKALQMELEDCCFPLLEEIKIGSDPFAVFESVDYAFLAGARPRGPGMERKDLITSNAKIFKEQGQALNRVASRKVKVLVIGNPCNTNCLIAIHSAPDLPPSSFYAMTRLDQNRAQAILARKMGIMHTEIANVIIWGNHSITQVPDVYQATIFDKKLEVQDELWLEKEFPYLVQRRGAEIIKARGKSSAASAAYASIQAMQDLTFPTKEGAFFSAGVYTEGLPYPLDKDLVFSVPCITTREGKVSVLSQIFWQEILQEKIKATEKELLEEREMAFSLLKK